MRCKKLSRECCQLSTVHLDCEPQVVRAPPYEVLEARIAQNLVLHARQDKNLEG